MTLVTRSCSVLVVQSLNQKAKIGGCVLDYSQSHLSILLSRGGHICSCEMWLGLKLVAIQDCGHDGINSSFTVESEIDMGHACIRFDI